MPNRNGARGIHTAAMKGHVAVINSLLAKGENVDAVTNVIDDFKDLTSHFKSMFFRTITQPCIWPLKQANRL